MASVERLLRASGMTAAQIGFARNYSRSRIRTFLSEPLSAEGAACGKPHIERAIYGCVAHLWPRLSKQAKAANPSLLSPKRFSDGGYTATNVGEMVYIGALNLCLGGARKGLLIAQ